MENIAIFIIPALVGLTLLRLMVMPIRLAIKLLLHAAGGLLCLWLLNTLAPFTGFVFPINAVTALVAGVLGVPGIVLLAVIG